MEGSTIYRTVLSLARAGVAAWTVILIALLMATEDSWFVQYSCVSFDWTVRGDNSMPLHVASAIVSLLGAGFAATVLPISHKWRLKNPVYLAAIACAVTPVGYLLMHLVDVAGSIFLDQWVWPDGENLRAISCERRGMTP